MEEYIKELIKEFREYDVFEKVSSYDGKKENIRYYYILHKNGLKYHTFELNKKVTYKELEEIFINSYIKSEED